MTLLTKAAAYIGFSVAIYAASGCNVQSSGHGPMQELTPQQRVQKQMEDVRNNPNMPPAAKEAALASLNAHSGGSVEEPGKKKK
jgi:hypothetical protein